MAKIVALGIAAAAGAGAITVASYVPGAVAMGR